MLASFGHPQAREDVDAEQRRRRSTCMNGFGACSPTYACPRRGMHTGTCRPRVINKGDSARGQLGLLGSASTSPLAFPMLRAATYFGQRGNARPGAQFLQHWCRAYPAIARHTRPNHRVRHPRPRTDRHAILGQNQARPTRFNGRQTELHIITQGLDSSWRGSLGTWRSSQRQVRARRGWPRNFC